MPTDLDVFRAANTLIKRWGADAEIRAAEQADAILEKGSIAGQQFWLRVLKAIDELQRQDRSEDEALH